jgi:aminocarboxymuconate-semialdehyde decarboxylase
MLGSDYPFPLGEENIGELIRNADGLEDATRMNLLGGNAKGFLGL